MVPAPAQGVLALQIRETDVELKNKLATINDEEVAKQIGIERGVLNLFDGGCQFSGRGLNRNLQKTGYARKRKCGDHSDERNHHHHFNQCKPFRGLWTK